MRIQRAFFYFITLSPCEFISCLSRLASERNVSSTCYYITYNADKEYFLFMIMNGKIRELFIANPDKAILEAFL